MILACILYGVLQVLMLIVITKYGNPLEENMRTLILNKLCAEFKDKENQRNNEELQWKRRHEAYIKLADEQINKIIRAMFSYAEQVSINDIE